MSSSTKIWWCGSDLLLFKTSIFHWWMKNDCVISGTISYCWWELLNLFHYIKNNSMTANTWSNDNQITFKCHDGSYKVYVDLIKIYRLYCNLDFQLQTLLHESHCLFHYIVWRLHWSCSILNWCTMDNESQTSVSLVAMDLWHFMLSSKPG